jgi:hypothetical protein
MGCGRRANDVGVGRRGVTPAHQGSQWGDLTKCFGQCFGVPLPVRSPPFLALHEPLPPPTRPAARAILPIASSKGPPPPSPSREAARLQRLRRDARGVHVHRPLLQRARHRVHAGASGEPTLHGLRACGGVGGGAWLNWSCCTIVLQAAAGRHVAPTTGNGRSGGHGMGWGPSSYSSRAPGPSTAIVACRHT